MAPVEPAAEGGTSSTTSSTLAGSTTNLKTAEAVLLDQKIKLRQRCFRTMSYVLVVMFLWGIWELLMLLYGSTSVTKRYDPARGLVINARSCDVIFYTGSYMEVTYTSRSRGFDVDWTYSTTNVQIATGLDARNPLGCDYTFGRRCESRCSVSVSVPQYPPPPMFEVRQDSDDPFYPVVDVRSTTLSQLIVGRWWRRVGSMSVFVANSTVSGFSFYGQNGDFKSEFSEYTVNVNVNLAKSGSIYMHNVPAYRRDLAVTYRNPYNRVCLGTYHSPLTARWMNPLNEFADCDFRSYLEGNTDSATNNMDYYHALASRYDADSNGVVSATEFETALNGMQCCGGDCPFTSSCASYNYDLGYGSASEASGSLAVAHSASAQAAAASAAANQAAANVAAATQAASQATVAQAAAAAAAAAVTASNPSGMAVYDFASRILAQNKSAWIPNCRRTVSLDVYSASVTQVYSMPELVSEQGEIQVDFNQQNPVRIAFDAMNLTYTQSADKARGLSILEEDARRFREEYGTKYGDSDSDEQQEAFIVIDVVGGDGAPPARWFYSTNNYYLALPPPFLTYLTASLLTPNIIWERVRFTDNSCSFRNGSRASDEEKMALWGRMYEYIHRALHSNPRDTSALRGTLVRLSDNVSSDNYYYYYPVDQSSGERTQLEWSDRFVEGNLAGAIALSLICGVLFGYKLFSGLTKKLGDILSKEHAAKKAARTALLSRMGVDPKMDLAVRKAGNEDEAEPPTNPWYAPFSLLTALFVAPLKAKYIDGLDAFVRGRLTIDKKGESKEFVYMRTFCRRYEIFCLEAGLPIESNRDELQRQLIAKYDCRVSQVLVARIHNLRWRTQADPPLPPPNQLVPMPQPMAPQPFVPPQSEAYAAAKQAKQDHTLATIRAFIERHCVVDMTPGTFLDLETRPGPDGHEKMGFKPKLDRWCKDQQLQTPGLTGQGWAVALPDFVKFNQKQKSRQVRGINWKVDIDAEMPSLSCKWYMVELMTVMIHIAAVMLLPMIAIFHAFVLQDAWATIMAPHNHQRPVVWNDFLGSAIAPRSELYVHPAVCAVVFWNLGFMLLSSVRYLANTLQLPRKSVALRVARILYMPVVALQVFGYLTYAGMIFLWAVFAAFLRPERFLPHGVGAIVVVATGFAVSRSMSAAAAYFNEKLREAHDAEMQVRMKKAMAKIEAKAITRLTTTIADKVTDGFEDDDTTTEGSQLMTSERVTPLDLFLALNQDGDSEMSMAEFRYLFELFELQLTEAEQEHLFAFADGDCTGKISAREFQHGWDQMTHVFLEASAARNGISKVQILAVTVSAVFLMLLLLFFVLLGLTSWQQESGFTASVQSLLIAGTGIGAALLRKKSKAEEGNVEALINRVMEEHKSAATED